MTIRKSVVTGLILGPACCGLAAAAEAQGAVGAAAPAPQLQQVTVTANFIRPGGQSALKMNVPVQDVPYSLEDYSQSFMQAVDTTKLTDLYGYMSGVQRAGRSAYDINIRGFTSGSTDPNSVLMDGLPGLPARTASPETSDIARVEVVKGPASVLYGQDQPGGFINLITKKPQEHPETNVEMRANTYDGAGIPFGRKNGYTGIVDTTGSMSGGETLLGRAIAEYTNQQSFREFVIDKDFMVAPSLTWNMSQRTRATLLLEYRRGNDSWDQGLVAPGFDSKLIAPITTRYQNPEDKEMEKGESATLLLHHAFSHSLSWDLNARSVYSEDHEIGFDNSAVLKNLTTLSRLDRAQDNHHHINFIDTSVTDLFHTGPIGHRLLAGATYGETIEDYNRIRGFKTPLLNINIYDPVIGYSDVPPPPASEPPLAHEWASAKQYGAYMTDLLTFSEHWKGVVGARYQDVKQLQEELRLPNTPNRSRDFNSAFPMGGLIYQPNREWSIYASYSSSFVPPSPTAQSVIPGQALQAQTATQEEAGAKFTSRDQRLTATVSFFNIKETNLIQEVGITGLYEQIGAVRSRGGEFELDYRPTDWWQLSANYALIDAKIIDDIDSYVIGSKPLNSPRNSGSVLSRVQMPGALRNFGWMLGAIYRSERVGNLPTSATSGEFIMPGYTTLDTGIYYTGDTYSISLKVSNVLDKQYFQSAFSAVRITPGDPRNIALTLDKTFE
ncbi:MAG TPA: TonB-dependent receptor [Steroidobacteraceae bacterium]|nr:TonB-dependent receptor [Steroidobacteraceae bacterium]